MSIARLKRRTGSAALWRTFRRSQARLSELTNLFVRRRGSQHDVRSGHKMEIVMLDLLIVGGMLPTVPDAL